MATLPALLDRFVHFLDISWPAMQPAFDGDKTSTLQIDWLQANWELIVEGGLLPNPVALRPYGDGADCNGASSRVLHPDRTESHLIVLEARQGRTLYDLLGKTTIEATKNSIVFDRFVSLRPDGWYHERPPFTHVLAEQEAEGVRVSREDAHARLEPTH